MGSSCQLFRVGLCITIVEDVVDELLDQRETVLDVGTAAQLLHHLISLKSLMLTSLPYCVAERMCHHRAVSALG